jgi:hypothetical protein
MLDPPGLPKRRALSVERARQTRPPRSKLFSSLRDLRGDFLEFQNWFLPLPHKRGRKRFLPSERGGLSVKDGLQKKFLVEQAFAFGCRLLPLAAVRRSWARLPEGNRSYPVSITLGRLVGDSEQM